MNIVELASFKLKEEISLEFFLEVSNRFQKEFVSKQPGFIQRQLIKKDNIWCDLVIWESQESAEAVLSEMGQSEAAQSYGSMIEPGSVTVEHFEVYQ